MLALVLVALLVPVALAGCSSGEARTVPTTVPPVTRHDGRLGIYLGVGTEATVAGIELVIADLNRAGGINGHPVRFVDGPRADLIIGGRDENAPDVEPVADDEAFLDRLRQVEPRLDAVDEAAYSYAAVKKFAAEAKPDEL